MIICIDNSSYALSYDKFCEMLFSNLVSTLLLSSFSQAFPSSRPKRADSVLPLSTKGRDIIDINGDVFHYVSTNWPGKYFDTVDVR